MSAFKIKPTEMPKLYQQEKQIVESLIKRLNDKIQKDPEVSKKAALIIENWLKKSRP